MSTQRFARNAENTPKHVNSVRILMEHFQRAIARSRRDIIVVLHAILVRDTSFICPGRDARAINLSLSLSLFDQTCYFTRSSWRDAQKQRLAPFVARQNTRPKIGYAKDDTATLIMPYRSFPMTHVRSQTVSEISAYPRSAKISRTTTRWQLIFLRNKLAR